MVFTVDYTLNTGGQVTDMYENGSTLLMSYVYDSQGRLIITDRTNFTSSFYEWNEQQRLSAYEHDLNNTNNDQRVELTYNPAGQITSRTNDNQIWEPSLTPQTREFEYNAVNQITKMRVAGGAWQNFAYDDNGNLTDDGSRTFTYDDANRLTSVNGSYQLDYDALGRLSKTTQGSSQTKYLYDGHTLIAQYNASGQLLRRFAYLPGATSPEILFEGDTLTLKRWLMRDERGSVTVVSGGSGGVGAGGINAYDEYGRPDTDNYGHIGYTGHMVLKDVDLLYARARIYNPEIARFMQMDPIGYEAGPNLYAYVNGDPVNFVDLGSGLITSS